MIPSRTLKSFALAALGSFLLASAATTYADAPAAPAAEKKPAWETSAAAGLTFTSGNSKTLLATASIVTLHKWTKNELSLGADGSYGQNDSVKNNESVHGFGQYNRLFNERVFGFGRVDALHDAIADVDYRVSLSAGAGNYFIKNKRTTLTGEFGPGVIFQHKGGENSTYMTLRIAERFEYKLTERAKVWQSLEFLPQVDDFNNYIVNFEVGIETALTQKMSLRTWIQDTYQNEPAANREKNDFKLVAGVGYKF